MNKCTLRAVLNVVMEGASLAASGKLFHAVGPATVNALFPSSRRVHGTIRLPHVADAEQATISSVWQLLFYRELSDVRRSHAI